MLEQVLRWVARGEVGTLDELAARLGVGRELAAQMLEELVRRGYLKLEVWGCPGECAGCAQARACAAGLPARLWTLTPKGRGALGAGS